MKYIAVLNKDSDSDYGVHFPDFLGCITAGSTIEEAKKMAQEVLTGHIGVMQDYGDFIPAPSSYEEIMKDPDNHGIAFFEVDVPEKDPAARCSVTLPQSVIDAVGEKNLSIFLTQAAREKLHLNTAGKHA